MKRYEKYKDSGIEWMGNIPEHWEIKRLKYVKARVKNSFVDGPFGSHLKTEHFIIDGDVFVIDSGYITSGEFINNKEFKTISSEHFETIKRSECKENDIIIAKIGANFGMSGILPKLEKPSVVSGNSLKLTIDSGYNLNFIHYQLLNLKQIGVIDVEVKGSAQPALSMQLMSEMPLLKTTFKEQAAITNYLDCKKAEIDELIAQKERLIELYEEEKAAIINQAVTKGIDPNAKLKDSDVDLLGKIPVGWEVKKLKYVAKIRSGFAFSSDDFVPQGVQLIKIANLYNNELHLERQPTFLSNEFLETHFDWIVTSGDILISMTGTLGKRDYGFAILLEQKEERFLLNQRVSKIVAGESISNRLLLFILRSEYFLNNLFSLPSGTKQGNFSNEQISNLSIAFPMHADQQDAINSFIETETARIDAKIAKTKRIIELQKEYRTALISEVVTGKIKVTEESTS